jgi:hypothetical protein
MCSLSERAMNREQAIAWLRSVGRNASARDWAFGATIFVGVGEPTLKDGITSFPGAVYLYPAADGSWNLLDCDVPDPAKSYENLESAVRGADEYVARKEQARVKGG